MAWQKTRNPWSSDAADPVSEKSIIDSSMLAGAWGTVPCSSKELDISEQLLVTAVRNAIRSISTSGWHVKGALNFSGGYAPNTFRMNVSRCMANGLFSHVVGTGIDSETESVIQLNSPPGAGTHDDLVFLEVWLAEVPGSTPSAPVSTFKPSTTAVWKYGNVQFGGTNPVDDINEVDAEIRRRIQIQYRIRTVSNINFTTYPLGLPAPTALAQGTNVSPTALPFAADSYDPKLYVAGNGSVAHQATLGTVDGRVYAIPIARVARTAGVTNILTGHVTDLRQDYGILAFVQRAGDTMTGNLSVVGAGTRTYTQDATGLSASSILELKGRDAGGTLVWLRLIADLAGVCGLVVVSNHGWNIKTNNVDRMQIAADGKLTKFPLGYESAELTITSASVITLAHGLPTVPHLMWVVLKCVVSQHGHAVGTEVTVPINTVDGTAENGVQLSVVSSNLYVNIGTDPIKVYAHGGGGVQADITNSSWRLIVRAIP